MSNPICSPSEGENRHWPKKFPPKKVGHRTLWVTVLASEGQTLEKCEDASDLCECLLHAMLDWLMAYSRGYMHRDIGISSVLKLLKPRVSPTGFNAVRSLGSLSGLQNLVLPPAISALAEKLDEALKPYQVAGGNLWKVIFTDDGMAAYIPTYFTAEHKGEPLSGTKEFMSTGLLYSMLVKRPIFHSPVDDLWSFFWTMLWATLFNPRHPGGTEHERLWRGYVRGEFHARNSVPRLFVYTTAKEMERCSSMMREMVPLLMKWEPSLRDMSTRWSKEPLIVQDDSPPADLCLLFHQYAYQGILDFVGILTESGLIRISSN